MYKYLKIPLTALVASYIIKENPQEKTLRRDEIIDYVVDYHRSNGGKDCESNVASTIKKALANLANEKYAQNVKQGYWSINGSRTMESTTTTEGTPNFNNCQVDDDMGYVYLYYYPTYKKSSLQNGKNTWPCKIGASERDAKERITQQIGTAFPESPEIGFIIRCKNPYEYESIIHKTLSIKGKTVPNSLGTEWFEIEPEEALSVIVALQLPYEKVC